MGGGNGTAVLWVIVEFPIRVPKGGVLHMEIVWIVMSRTILDSFLEYLAWLLLREK